MIPAAPLTLRIALVAALAVFALSAAQRFAAWRLPRFVIPALAALTLLPVAWRFFEFPTVMGEPRPWPTLRVAFILAPLILFACTLGSGLLSSLTPVLAAATPLLSLVLLFLLRAAVMSGAPAGAGPDDPVLWLMTGSMVMLASLGLYLSRGTKRRADRA